MNRTAFSAHLSGRSAEVQWPQSPLKAKGWLGGMQKRHEGDQKAGEKWLHSGDTPESQPSAGLTASSMWKRRPM